jgi:hypothetical protein
MDEYIPPELRSLKTQRKAPIKSVLDPVLVTVSILMTAVSIPVFLFVSWPVGVLLFILSDLPILCATRWRCSACGNRVSDKLVRLCPTCRATLYLTPSPNPLPAILLGLGLGIPIALAAGYVIFRVM